MLLAKTTPLLMGIEAMGDYMDFQRLHGAIRSLLDQHHIGLEHNNDPDATDAKEILIGLSFDINTLIRGFHKIKRFDNGVSNIQKQNSTVALYAEDEMTQILEQHEHGNLYYSLKIPYVEAMGYLLILNEALAISDTPACRKREGTAGLPWVDSAAGMEDRACIAFFTACLGNALCESLGEACYREIWALKKKRRWIPNYQFRYIELLNAFYLTKCCDLSKVEKAGVLHALLRLLLRSPKDAAVEGVSRAELIALLPDYAGFSRFMKVFADASEDGEVYMDEIFGCANRKDMTW